jgi:hypothetical protein
MAVSSGHPVARQRTQAREFVRCLGRQRDIKPALQIFPLEQQAVAGLQAGYKGLATPGDIKLFLVPLDLDNGTRGRHLAIIQFDFQ